MITRLGLLATLLACPLFHAGCTSDTTGSLTVDNEESFEITDIYVDDVGNDDFSDNLLGSVPLQPGESITIDVACGTYDVEIVDESGADCVVHDTDICASSDEWLITDSFCPLSARTASAPTAPLTIKSSQASRLVSR